ncbi:MAG: hypothetical protein A2Z16_03945 [Chloroflexi bacterium RBG_16_54_18]|nr:MAG: hypothetical protein A2Z16_03945 [Chloroflexi bacterium RBG_16_54_18]
MIEKLEWISSVLKTTPDRWLNLAEMLPALLMVAKPAPLEWSAAECLVHLVDLEVGVFHYRVQAVLAGQDFPAFDPETQGVVLDPGYSPLTLAWKFNQQRREGLALIEKLQPADLEKTSRHTELGVVTLSELLNEWAAHDLVHTMQAERALMQPFILGCGPWKKYFEEHIWT